jgi:hypothetical protein
MRRPGFDTRLISWIAGSPSLYLSCTTISVMPGRTVLRLYARMKPSRCSTSSTRSCSFEPRATMLPFFAR